MKSLLRMVALAVAVAASARSGQAAFLQFSGVTIAHPNGPGSAGVLQPGNQFTLFVEFAESSGSSRSIAATSTLEILTGSGLKTLRMNSVDAAGTITITAPNQISLSIDFDDPTAAAGQPTTGTLSMTITAPGANVPAVLSQANVSAIVRPFATYAGALTGVRFQGVSGVSRAGFAGTIPVPEPGSISLLAGLGLVCGRRVWRRRQQKQAAAV